MSINYTGSGGGIPRKTAKIFAENSDTNDMTVFGSTLANNTTYSKDLDSIQSSAYETGWRDAVISNLNYPLLSDMNGVQHVLSQQIAYILQHGCPEWNAGTTYYAYDLVASGGIIYTSLIDENTNNPVTDTTKWAVYYSPADFLNKKQITNCILEAPNGVVTYSGSVITAHSGLKLLIPDGKNADGTLKNIEITLDNNVTRDITLDNADHAFGVYCIFIDENKQLVTACAYSYYHIIGSTPPTDFANGYASWYDTINNVVKTTSDSGTTWTIQKWCLIGTFTCTPNTNTITAIGSFEGINLLKLSDRYDISSWALPSNKYISMILGPSGTLYRAPANGWFVAWSVSTNIGAQLYLFNISNQIGFDCWVYASGVTMRVACPVRKGDIIASYDAWIDGNQRNLRFVYAQGEI